MSFKFDFDIDADNEEPLDTFKPSCDNLKSTNSILDVQVSDDNPVISFLQGQEIFVDDAHLKIDHGSERKLNTISLSNGRKLICISTREVEREQQQQDSDKRIDVDSDLIPRIYEGGLKVWDGSMDLLRFISERAVLFTDLKVLELGCGVGLPGQYALTEGATVHFQDYNEEVIRRLTVPTVCLNSDSSSLALSRARFFSGDWVSVRQLLLDDGIERDPSLRYDVILTAETIYSLDSYKKLHDIMQAVLKPSGVIYLAAKTYYFGVGGGTREFQKFVNDKAVFDSVVVDKIENDGVYREVIKLTFRPAVSI